MADAKREITYHFGATENVTDVSKKVNDALRRSRAEAGKGGGLLGAIRGVNDQAKGLGLEGRDSIFNFVRGAGAAGIAVVIGQALQGLPDAARKFKEALSTGGSRIEATSQLIAESLPVVGELAKGFAALRDEINGARAKFDADEKRRGAKADLLGLTATRDKRRGEDFLQLTGPARSEIDAAFLAPLDGTRRARMAARQERDKTLKEIAEAQNKVGTLGPDQQVEANAKLNQRRHAANIRFREEERRLDEQDAQRLAQAKANAIAAELTTVGRGFEAETLLRKEAVNQQIADLKRTGTAEEIEFAKRKANAEELAAQERENIAQREKRFSFAEMGIQFLEREVELGRGALSVDVQRLKINEDFARQRAELDDLLKKENLDAQSRDALKELRGQLDQQEQAALQNVNRGRFSGGVAPGGEDRFGTGVVAAGRENDPANKIQRNTADSAALLKKIHALLEKQDRTSGLRGGGGSVELPPLP